MVYTIRKAILEDKPALETLIALSTRVLCAPDYCVFCPTVITRSE